MANIDNELDEIRQLLGMDDPVVPKTTKAAAPQPTNSFNLGNILEEIGGVVEKTQAENAKKPIEIPVELAKIDVQHLVDAQDLHEAEQVMQRAEPTPVSDSTMKIRKQPMDQTANIGQNPTRTKKAKRKPVLEEDDAARQTFAKPDGRDNREKQRMRAENETLHARDPKSAMRNCVGRVRNLSLRIIVVTLVAMGLLYLSIANTLGLPVPDSMNFATATRETARTMLLLQIVAMVFSVDVIGAGFYNLVTGRAERASLVTCACMATLLHSACLYLVGWGAYLPYCGISVWLLVFSMVEDRNRHAGRARAFKTALSASEPYTVVAHADQVDGVRRTSKRPSEHVENFLLEMERPDTTEYFSRIYVPIMLAASIVFAGISCYHRKDYNSFLWTLSAILSMATPLALIGAFGTAYARASRRLLEEGAAIASARAAISIRSAREVILTDADIFPNGTVSVKEARTSGSHTPEKLLAYAAATAEACDISMASVLKTAQSEQYGRPIHAQEPRSYANGGMSAQILGDTFLMGTAAFMSQMQVPVVEERGEDIVVFMAINGSYAGSLHMKYHPSSNTYHSMQAFGRLRIHPVLAQHDCNISAGMVERMFDIKRGTVGEMTQDRIKAVRAPEYTADEPEGALLMRNGLAAVAQVHVSADRLSYAVRANLILGAFAGLCGSLLMFYLTFMGVYEAIVPFHVAIYLLLWYLPALVITYAAGNTI